MANTNKESYLSDLEEIRNRVDSLLAFVPVGKTARDKKAREEAEEIASQIRALTGCMKNDYIPEEL